VESLVSLAPSIDQRPVTLPDGSTVSIRALHIAFSRATPNRLPDGTLPRTYTVKPLVSVNGAAMFGELAIVRWLEKDGWEAVWMDTSHGAKFWKAMPHKSQPVALPPPARALYDAIRTANGGKASGTFDVMAWRNGEFAFLEYRGEDDRPNRNEARWIEAALETGVLPTQLWFVLHPANEAE
jgi:hypothetical protein